MRNIVINFMKTAMGSIVIVILTAISGKISAQLLGPVGTGLIGQLNQLLIVFSEVATLAGATALVQGFSSRKGQERDEFLVTVFLLYLLGTIVSSLILVFGAEFISQYLMGSNERVFVNIVRFMSIVVVFNALYLFISRVINGNRDTNFLVFLQILCALIAALISYPLIVLIKNGEFYAVIGLICLPVIFAGLVGCFYLYLKGLLKPILRISTWSVNIGLAKSFLLFSASTFTVNIMLSGGLLLLRSSIIKKFGLVEAGIFGAGWSVSMSYISLILGVFGTYYLPLLSQNGQQGERDLIVQNTLKVVIAISVPLMVLVITLKPLLIHLLYSKEFDSSLNMMRWMLVGDYFKVSAYIFSVLFLAFPNMKLYLRIEVLWLVSFIVFSEILSGVFASVESIGFAFLISYILYLYLCWRYAMRSYNLKLSRSSVLIWILGGLLIGIASISSWNDYEVYWEKTIVFFMLSIFFTLGVFFGRSMIIAPFSILFRKYSNNKL